MFAIAAHLSNYGRFLRRDIAIALSPVIAFVAIGIFSHAENAETWMIAYGALLETLLFVVPLAVVPIYLRFFCKLEERWRPGNQI